MSGVTLGGGFVVLEDMPEDEKNAHGQWLARHFPHLRDQELTHEERVSELTGLPVEGKPPTASTAQSPALPEIAHGPRGEAPHSDSRFETVMRTYFPSTRRAADGSTS